MRLRSRRSLPVALLSMALAGPLAASASANPGSGVVGHVYVNDNTAAANTIAGFDRHRDGTLTPLPGSPFSAGGAGTGASLPSQGALELTDGGRYLLAVDAGSSQISVLRVRHDGSLRLVQRAPVASGGSEPVSVAVHRGLVYVANAGAGGSNYTGFSLNPGGRLTPLAGSTFPLPDGSGPGDVIFNSSGTKLVGVRVNTSLIDSFQVGRDGRLSAAPTSPLPAQGAGPFGSEFRPTNPSQLYVSNAHNGPGLGSVSAFSVAPDAGLTSIGSSPFSDNQTAPCWVEISHDGQYLFAVNTAQPSVSRYAINPDGTLTLLGSTAPNDPIGLGPTDERLSPDGNSLWVLDSKRLAVSGFAVSGGDLAEFSSSPTALPANATPSGIAVN